MSIITENKYLDECSFSSGLIKDEDCADIADWTTDGDTGTGVSSQIFFDSKSCFKMDVVSAGGGNLASRSLDIGSYQTNPNVISIKLYHDTLGTLANVDYFELLCYATSYYLGIRFASDGLFIYDGAAWNEVGADLVQTDTWQEWTFSWTQQAAGVVDVYLNGNLQASSVDCSTSSGSTSGTTTFRQYGTTVIGLTYIDWIKAGNTKRYGGETLILQEGAELTIRTDSRWHANSPASMLGSFGAQTLTEGKVILDGSNVRWLAITGGSGDSPIGTIVTQGGVSGYYLGYWASKTSAPATAIGATGFLKFREVTGGAFSAGALSFGSGTGAATAAGADVTGWIEVVADSATTITVPRLGEYKTNGGPYWFYLENTTGVVAQTLQVPTNGGGADTYCPGCWIETGVGSDEYEYWPAVGATTGWTRQHLGNALGEQDRRQNFVKSLGGGQMQIGEVSDLSAAYANVAAQASTYATLAHSCTYTVVSNVCTITYASGHLLKTGATVGVDFTSGGASALDGSFTITVLDAYTYTFALTTGDTSGNATVRPGVTVSFNTHALGVGDVIYFDATSGTLPDGEYTIYAVTSANAYLIAYPHTAALTPGAADVYSRYVITHATHLLAVGNRVYLNFTTGSGVDGIYTIVAVPDANTFHVVANNGAAGDAGDVTIQQIIGNIPVSGCKVRIPNIFLREAATATRASNMVNATIGSRPEFLTTSAGAIDLTGVYSTWYFNFLQPYSVKLHDSCFFDSALIAECATALDIDNFNASMYGNLDVVALGLTSDFAGGTVQNSKYHRGNAPGSSDHALSLSYCLGQIFTNVEAGILQYVRSTGQSIVASYGGNLEFNSCRTINGGLALAAVLNAEVNDLDYVDRFIGYTNATTGKYPVNVVSGCVNIKADGITIGYDGNIINNHSHLGLVYYAGGTIIRFRNIGTFDNPIPCGNWRQNLYAMGVCCVSAGNNYDVKNQRIYADDNMRTSPFTTLNSDKNVVHESVFGGRYTMSGMTPFLLLDAGLNSVMKGCKTGASSVAGQSSVYGTHFFDMFMGDVTGRLILAMNEPTAETEDYFTMVSGTQKFNSVGGILMGVVGDQAVWEDQYYRKGHTAFANTTPTMSGGTIGNYTLEYDIDVNDGNGFTDSWTTLSGANLSGETIDPADGFKLKIRITTTTANLTAITYLRIDTISSASAQENNLYPLDLVPVTITVIDAISKDAIEGARVFIETDPAGTDLVNDVTDSNGIVTFDYDYTADQDIVGRVRKASSSTYYKNSDIIGTITDEGYSATILLIEDE